MVFLDIVSFNRSSEIKLRFFDFTLVLWIDYAFDDLLDYIQVCVHKQEVVLIDLLNILVEISSLLVNHLALQDYLRLGCGTVLFLFNQSR